MKDIDCIEKLAIESAMWMEKNRPDPDYVYFLNSDDELWGSWRDGTSACPLPYSQYFDLIELAIDLGMKITIEN